MTNLKAKNAKFNKNTKRRSIVKDVEKLLINLIPTFLLSFEGKYTDKTTLNTDGNQGEK